MGILRRTAKPTRVPIEPRPPRPATRDDPPLELWRDTAGFAWCRSVAATYRSDGAINLSLLGQITAKPSGSAMFSSDGWHLVGVPWQGTYEGAQQQLERLLLFMRGHEENPS